MPFPTIVHPLDGAPHDKLVAYESGPADAENALVVVGGLTDGPHTLDYVRTVVERLTRAARTPSYGVWEVRMYSSYLAFGHSSLKNDVADISSLVAYLRKLGKKKVVLAGHSTGCQDMVAYADPDNHAEPVDGYVLQAPVSDRQVFDCEPAGAYDPRTAVAHAEAMIADGRQLEYMPIGLLPVFLQEVPMTAYRFWSLVAKGGDDDFFSSDLSDDDIARFFRRFDKPVMVVPGRADEFVPPSVDLDTLLARWKAATRPGLFSDKSEVMATATHMLDRMSDREAYADKLVAFLQEDVAQYRGE